MLLKPVKSTDLLLDENTIGSESPTAHHRLLDQPPPLPPKQSIINNFKSSNLVSSFRRRGRSDATEMTPRDPVLRRSSQRDDIHLLRSAFNAHQSIYRGKVIATTRYVMNSTLTFWFQHRLGRHQLDDTDNADQEDAFYNQLKMRHVKAKRISLMMLKKQIYLEDDSHHQNHDPAFGRSRHLSCTYLNILINFSRAVEFAFQCSAVKKRRIIVWAWRLFWGCIKSAERPSMIRLTLT